MVQVKMHERRINVGFKEGVHKSRFVIVRKRKRTFGKINGVMGVQDCFPF